MAKGLLDMLLDEIFDANWLGKHGEKLTARELKWLKFFGRKGKILKNVYIPKPNGETSEIDILYITAKGIFVIESKNYSGWIFGDENSLNWTAMLPNKQKNKFYNPIKQNDTHMKYLAGFIEEEIPLFSIIAFSERCELKKVTIENSEVKVIKRDRLYVTVKHIWDNSPDIVSEQDIENLYSKLEPLTKVDKATKALHIENINKKIVPKSTNQIIEKPQDEKLNSNNQDNPPIKNEQDDLICPKCQSKLVLRIAKQGANAGNSFYGCSNFPKCRYIKNT